MDLKEKSFVNINGTITKAMDAKISVFDRGFLFGDSVYEVTRSYSNKIFLLPEHLTRLRKSASLLDMPIFFSDDEITEELNKTLSKLNLPNAYIRIIINMFNTYTITCFIRIHNQLFVQI